jgi:hypothetical protein
MGAGTLALAVAWLLLGQAPDEVYHTNQRDLSVPIVLPDNYRSQLRDLLLFASWDQGQTYELVNRVPPEKREFEFKANNDGTCWLKVAVINLQGKQEPENIQQLPPSQKIVIDTMRPVVRTFTAQRQGDEVTVAWDILEDHLDPRGFRLEYQSKDNPSGFWTPIPAIPGLTGQQRFRPTSASPLVLRLAAKDQAGNQSYRDTEVAGGITAVSYSPPVGTVSNQSAPASGVLPPPAPPPSTGNSLPPPPLPMEAVKQPQQQRPSAWAASGAIEVPKNASSPRRQSPQSLQRLLRFRHLLMSPYPRPRRVSRCPLCNM